MRGQLVSASFPGGKVGVSLRTGHVSLLSVTFSSLGGGPSNQRECWLHSQKKVKNIHELVMECLVTVA